MDWLRRSVYGRNGPPLGAEDQKYTRTTMTDAKGNFSFSNLPNGEYVVLTEVYWEAPQVDLNGFSKVARTGGPISGRVTVEDGAASKVFLH